MHKKFWLILGGIAVATISVISISAFEARVINVTAVIENSISVNTTSINFGTVFPQEALDEYFELNLSQSFLEQERVDTVNYIVRQKPKCWSEIEQAYGLVKEDEQGNFICADGDGYEILPVLCPFLSKHEITEDGEVENDSEGINAFHGPIADWNLSHATSTQVAGQLVNDTDITDQWEINLRVPCFEGNCAQDWDEFVLANNPDADPAAYILPNELEHQLFGCDLWVEVTGISDLNNLESACLNSGGIIKMSDCCLATNDFPDLCSIGACGCAPGDSHEIKICDCGEGQCFDGGGCVQIIDEPVCGNGVEESGEECDDGNTEDGDGCSAICQIEQTCIDADGDGYCTVAGCQDCPNQEEDCDDTNPNINLGASEVCNDVEDNDCDGLTDCADSDCDSDPDCQALVCTDNDTDGYATEGGQCGEEDCDDDNILINPGAGELCDGEDNDCDQEVDEEDALGCIIYYFDQDGDTYGINDTKCLCAAIDYYTAMQDDDCDDSNASTSPAVLEICDDGVDNDCDSFFDCDDAWCSADPVCTNEITAGDIVINEIMQDPCAVNDNFGEWFELYNNTSQAIDLENCIISDDGSNSFTVNKSVIIAANGYVVFTVNGTYANNGGVNSDFDYPNSFYLGNDDDEIILTCNGVEIDRVAYDGGPNFPDPTGASMILANFSLDNTIGANWCISTSSYGSGDLGTPGAVNDSCSG